jgi:predicted nucleotide-binding protein
MFIAQRQASIFLNTAPESFSYEMRLDRCFAVAAKNAYAQIAWLQALVARLDLYAEPEVGQFRESASKEPFSNRIFIIHGHDHDFKDAVAGFLRSLDFEPIILHEKANESLTIFEKFLKYADVGFAVALFTPDDYGGPATNIDNDGRRLRDAASHESRARQNVVFETGFFYGRLERGRVVALRKGDVSIHSDMNGVLYIPVDAAGHWKRDLAREIKVFYPALDLNRVP